MIRNNQIKVVRRLQKESQRFITTGTDNDLITQRRQQLVAQMRQRNVIIDVQHTLAVAAWRWVVALLSIAALIVLARVAVRVLADGGWPARLSVALIFGGAMGNLIDRGRLGAVVDFVDVYYRGYHWPAFNVADSAITIGVVVLALRLLLTHPATESAG